MNLTQVLWTVLATVIVTAATVALCLHDLSSVQWIALVGAGGVLGGAGVHLSSSA